MKELREIYEGILDADFATDKNIDQEVAKDTIMSWIKENYTGDGLNYISISKRMNRDGKYVVNVTRAKTISLNSTSKSLTNGLFVWGDIKTGTFKCCDNPELTSLEGSPRKCRIFDCSNCSKLETLDSSPSSTDIYYCRLCMSLKSLKGITPSVTHVDCSGCTKLTSLIGLPDKLSELRCNSLPRITSFEGCPSEVNSISIKQCMNLNSLKGLPKKVGYRFDCTGQGPGIDTDELIEKYSYLRTDSAKRLGCYVRFSVWV